MTLKYEDMEKIVMAMLIGSKIDVTGPDADEFIKQFQADMVLAKKKGWNIVIPHDIEDISNPDKVKKQIRVIKGGPGSGHFGHAGRPGKVGGSAPSGEKVQLPLFDKPEPYWVTDERITNRLTEGGDSIHRKGFTEDEAQAFWDMLQESEMLQDREDGRDYAQKEYIHNLAIVLGLDGEYEARDVANLLYDAYEYHDPDSKFKAQIESIVMGWGESPTRFSVHGLIKDGEGNSAGTFTRIFYLGDNGENVVEHHYFSLYGPFQNEGFGSAFYENSEIAYMNAGLDAIYLEADIDVGGYAWARMGFDFRDDYTLQSHKDSFAYALSRMYPNEPYIVDEVMDNVWHSWDIAAYVGPDGRRVGKTYLLGKSYEAEKILSPWSMGVQVGEAYFEAKNKEKKRKKA